MRRMGEIRKGKHRRLSSEMLKRKRPKGNGSQALIPEEKTKREAPVERLWERNREGRKETNRKLSTRTGKESMRDQAGENRENQRSESRNWYTEEAAVEAETERKRKGRNRRLSSRNRKRSRRKKADRKGKDRKRKHKVST